MTTYMENMDHVRKGSKRGVSGGNHRNPKQKAQVASALHLTEPQRGPVPEAGPAIGEASLGWAFFRGPLTFFAAVPEFSDC